MADDRDATPPTLEALEELLRNQRPPTPRIWTGVTLPPPPPADTTSPPPPADAIQITFAGSSGDSFTFKMKPHMQFAKAMNHYSARVQTPVTELRFLFEGERLQPADTPESKEMENDDKVDVHREQIGGGSSA